MLDVSMTNEEKVKVTLAPKTAAGNDATLDGEPTWEVLSGDATVEPESGGLTAWIISGGAGPSVVRVSADADLGEGVRPIEDTVNVNVSGAEAASLGLTAEAPIPKEDGGTPTSSSTKKKKN